MHPNRNNKLIQTQTITIKYPSPRFFEICLIPQHQLNQVHICQKLNMVIAYEFGWYRAPNQERRMNHILIVFPQKN